MSHVFSLFLLVFLFEGKLHLTFVRSDTLILCQNGTMPENKISPLGCYYRTDTRPDGAEPAEKERQERIILGLEQRPPRQPGSRPLTANKSRGSLGGAANVLARVLVLTTREPTRDM